MKKTNIRTAMILVAAAFFFLLTTAFTHKKDAPNEDRENVCLEISGKIGFDRMPEDPTYKVELIHYNTVIKSETVKARSTFRFHLEKDAYYTIRISKEGYVSKMVSICTLLEGKETDPVFCKLHFSTALMEETEAAGLDQEALEFPIALIKYDRIKKNFYNCDKYTMNIKKQLYSLSTVNK